MNILIIDDIKILGNSIGCELDKINDNLHYNCSYSEDVINASVCIPKKDTEKNIQNIFFHHYNVDETFEANIKIIADLINEKKIDVLALDRGYSKICEDEELYIYRSIEEIHRYLKVLGEEVLLGKSDTTGLLELLNKKKLKLKSILLYTYDKGNNKIDIVIEDIKIKINSKLESLNSEATFYCFETSTVFNKPTNLNLNPDSIYYCHSNSDNTSNSDNQKVEIGTKKAFIEYGKLIANIINDSINDSAKKIESFFNLSNTQYNSYLRIINNLSINDNLDDYSTNATYSKFDLTTVSALFSFNKKEEYVVDIPYKEYYKELNQALVNNGLLKLFKDVGQESYLSNEYVAYCYNYNAKSGFDLYKIISSDNIVDTEDKLKKDWLPYLHAGAFHDDSAWKEKRIKDKSHDQASKEQCITLIFYFDTLDDYGFDGHINFTFCHQGKDIFNNIKSEIEAIRNYKIPLLKVKANEVLIANLNEEIEKKALRAAISQVMARNTSHNIGAHVMNKLIDKKYLEKIDVKNVEKEYNYQTTNIKSENDQTDNLSAYDADKFSQIAYFNNYVKCRMDYLADVTFGSPQMQTNKYVFNDLFKELDKVRLLLEHITGLSNFQYDIVFKRNGKDITNDNDLLVAIPNDILGMQAFYNILENFVRNSAKHAKEKPLKTTFTVNFIDDIADDKEENALTNEQKNILQELVIVEIYDNIIVEEQENADETEIHKYKEILAKQTGKSKDDIKPLTTKIDWLVFNQNERINADILDKTDNNKLRTSSLGVIEMDASAAYLRKRDVSYINHPNYDVQHDEFYSNLTGDNKNNRGTHCRNFLKAFKKEGVSAQYENEPQKRTGSTLGYRFFLLKPQVVLVVTDETTNKEELKKNGIWLITKSKFIEDLKAGKTFAHDFVVYETNDDVKKLIDNNKTALSLRIIELPCKVTENNSDIKQEIAAESSTVDTLLLKNSQEIEEFCWKKWDNIALDLNFKYNSLTLTKDKLASGFCNHTDGYLTGVDSECYFYYDALSSQAQSKLPNFKEPLTTYLHNNINNLVVKTKVGESIIAKIFVIDERIQENSKEKFIDVEISTIYKMTGIIVPDATEINLSANELKKDYFIKIIEKNTEFRQDTKCKKYDNDNLVVNIYFILIHYSILERIYQTNKSDINDFLIKLSKYVNVVITSGRGEPEALPTQVRFINLSAIVHALVETRSKYFINYILHASRKSNKTKK